jgi:uncharacterized protein (DUF58 family)
MLTARARTFLLAAGVFYLFANQTQVGWLYVLSAVLAGLVLAAGWLSRGTLRYLNGERRLGVNADADFYEGETITIDLTLLNERGLASQVRLQEHCPLASLDSLQRDLTVFIASLGSRERVALSYEIELDRRGLHEFPPITLKSSAPFGFFHHRRLLDIQTKVLVYPEVRPLRHLDLLDRQLAPQIPRIRSGTGYEVLGVRPFRSGDSPRHIHWRSVARTGELISKDFADEAQPGLTLILDLFGHPYAVSETKHIPFEWAVKCAASIGDLALTKSYPLHTVADADAISLPAGPVSRWALLQYLARVQSVGKRKLAHVIGQQPMQTFAAIILPYPDRSVIETLVSLYHRRIEILAVVIDPSTFPESGPSSATFVDEIRSIGIDVCHIKFGEDWASQLSERVNLPLHIGSR